ncbi:MAG: hypothetical protein JWP30_67 [Homoserinimonas sp.]|nr:hypothetical protein [Homoserinimonas sp.]
MARLAAEYILPLRSTSDAGLGETTAYLAQLGQWLDVTVVDGSVQPLFQQHAELWSATVQHIAPEPWPGANGKVAGVMTGLRCARHDRVVIADDDVRYRKAEIRRIVEQLADADIVRPQNYFSPLPWHARWDTARTLVNRAFGSDYPGSLAVRRNTVLRAGGYNGDVLFENLELIRTVRAVGGREICADGLYVARLPPATSLFWHQRVRQAYDDFAQPRRLALEMTLLPLLVWAFRRPMRTVVVAGLVCALAETGRRRAGGAAVFPATSALWAPLWVGERAVCVWLALGARGRGGISYHGRRLKLAATPERKLTQSLRRLRTEERKVHES